MEVLAHCSTVDVRPRAHLVSAAGGEMQRARTRRAHPYPSAEGWFALVGFLAGKGVVQRPLIRAPPRFPSAVESFRAEIPVRVGNVGDSTSRSRSFKFIGNTGTGKINKKQSLEAHDNYYTLPWDIRGTFRCWFYFSRSRTPRQRWCVETKGKTFPTTASLRRSR